MVTDANINGCVTRRQHPGYTLIELMIVLVILGVLAAIAIPAYSKVYVKRAKFSEVVTAAAHLRQSIEICFQLNQSLEYCDNDSTSVPPGKILDSDLTRSKIGQYVSDVTVQNNTGRITAIGTNEVYSAHLVLTPAEVIDNTGKKQGTLRWDVSGTCTGLYLC